MRSAGKVQNFNLSKRDTEIMINELWIAREAQIEKIKADMLKTDKFNVRSTVAGSAGTAAGGGSGAGASSANPIQVNISSLPKFSDFFYNFLLGKYKERSRAVEYAYNFVDALRKYSRDSDCKLFLLILNEEISEEVYHSSQ
jgi:hypothetical protein